MFLIKRFRNFALSFAILFGCLSYSFGQETTEYPNTPIGITQKLIDSMQENDANKYLDSITREDRREPGFFFYRQLVQGVFSLGNLGDIDAADIKVSFRELNFEEVYNDGSAAVVKVSGVIRDLNVAMESDFESEVVVLRREGLWLVSITTNPSTILINPESTAEASSQPISVHLKSISVGEDARQQINKYVQDDDLSTDDAETPNEGWQFVAIELILQNETVSPMSGPNFLKGAVIDSGGYRRDIYIDTCAHLCASHTYKSRYIIPQTNHLHFGYTQIPLNQSPVAIELGFENDPPVYFLDINKPEPLIGVPAVGFLPEVPIDTDNEITVNVPNEYNVTFSNFRFRPNQFWEGFVTLDYDITVENLGGFDLGERDIKSRPAFIAFDDEGLYRDNFDVALIEYLQVVPPSLSKTYSNALLFTLGRPFIDFNWIWIIVLDPGGWPVAQFKMSANGNILEDFDSNIEADLGQSSELDTNVEIVEDSNEIVSNLTIDQNIILYAADNTEVLVMPSIDETQSIALPSGIMAKIIASEPITRDDELWFQVSTTPDNINGWAKQSQIIPLNISAESTFNEICPGAGGYHFSLGQRFIVPYGDGPTAIRAEPNDDVIIERVNEGQGGYILDGPVCVGGKEGSLLTWYVKSDSGSEGWVAEGYADSPVPWIIPVISP